MSPLINNIKKYPFLNNLMFLHTFSSRPLFKFLIKTTPSLYYFSQTSQTTSSTSETTSQSTETFNPYDIFDIGEVKPSKGSLIIIPTPIGNLRDLSVRQYEALLSVDILACEDTRVTGTLLTLIKKRKLKDQMEDELGVNLKDLKAEDQVDDKDTPKKKPVENTEENLKEEDDALKEMALKASPGTEVKDYEQRKRLREELRIKAIKTKAKRILEGVDSLSFMSNFEGTEKNEGEEDLYGLEDDFMSFLKRKIAESRVKRGRGLLLSYHSYNEQSRIQKLIKAMKYGFKIGLVCDAGTPTISDPGYKLVDTALKEGIIIEALPGPSSISVALSLSGFPSDNYSFDGYLSKNQDEKLNKLENVKRGLVTSVLFESFHRLDKTLMSIEKIFGPNQVIFLGFEMTKMFEKTYRKTVKELIEIFNNEDIKVKGELTMIIPPYMRKYNKDIPGKKIETEEIDLDKMPKKAEKKERDENDEEEKKSMVFEQDKYSIHKINENHLMEVLSEKFDINDKQMADVVGEILKLSRTRSLHIVRRFRESKSKPSGKIFNSDIFKI